jgi:hypothetical protein
VEIDLFMEAFHFGMLEMHRTMYKLTLQAKFLNMGTSQVKLPKTFVVEVSKRRDQRRSNRGSSRTRLPEEHRSQHRRLRRRSFDPNRR